MYVHRIIAGVSGTAGSLQALRYATQLARHHDAELTAVLAWLPPGGDLADRRFPCPQLRDAWVHAAWARLWHAVDLAIGGPPQGMAFRPQVVRGDPGQVLTQVAARPGDVLVIGAGRQGSARRIMACKVARYCLGHASCPVICVPPAQLAAQAHGLRGWVARHRLDPQDALHSADA